jgi:hypothetical protein
MEKIKERNTSSTGSHIKFTIKVSTFQPTMLQFCC